MNPMACICCGEDAVLKDSTNDERMYCHEECQLIYHTILPYWNTKNQIYPSELYSLIFGAKQKKSEENKKKKKKKITLKDAMGTKVFYKYTNMRKKFTSEIRDFKDAVLNKSIYIPTKRHVLIKSRNGIMKLLKKTLKMQIKHKEK
jgi:hypothetical protein